MALSFFSGGGSASHANWHLPSSSAGGGRKSWRERVIYEKTWRFRDPGKGKTEILPAGNYEYPFNLVLEGNMPESIEGLSDTYITYRFKAEIGRKYAKDIIVRKPLRIIRTLEPSALELAHAMVSDTSPVIRNTYKNTRTILNDEFELDHDNALEIIDEAAEGYQFSRYLDLPKTLTRCLQDTDTKGIKVRHKLKFRVQLMNPDGHISENNNLVDQTPQSAQRAINDIAQQAPPLYGEHQFDQLYSELDPNGYRTPGPGSGPGTPFGTLSRNLSAENLASMNALTNTDISASALHSRLSNLSNLNITRPHQPSPTDHESQNDSEHRRLGVPADYFGPSSGSNSHSPSSPVLSRRPSDEVDHEHVPSGMVTPFHPQYAEVETLSRVPSYSTAVRTTVRPHDSDLPDYDAVVAEDIPVPPPLQSPQQAHIRNAGRGSSQLFSSLDILHHRPGLGHSHSSSHDDEDRRLRLVQARARV
ncbi:unnamed protein product [Aspergillus oryzae var. brunneus]|uniref:Unnamed protein product n=1 Tax=Aspergillus oryzae var. brunneus TaxID=332754 RepID=A0ABQ6L9R8_ASPOZ|nr:unnamed protein product [Aspergillus oryzae var. brunneus]